MRISDWSSDVCSSDLSFALDTGTFDIQAGGKARLRKKTFEYTQDKYDGVDGELTLADVLGRQSYSLADIEPVVGKEGERDLLAGGRSEESRVGKECVSTGRSRWSPCH